MAEDAEQTETAAAGAPEPLSVCIIAQDEEDRIAACIESVPFAQEIIVVDSGSTDRTVTVAEKLGARVIRQAWLGYVDQKNFAVAQASCDWVLCLDADEQVSTELAAELTALLPRIAQGTARANGYTMPRQTRYLGRWIRHGGYYPDRKLRLYDRRCGCWIGQKVHERAQVEGLVEALRGDLIHYTYRDISHHLRKIDAFTTMSAEQMYERGQRGALWHMLANPEGRFLRMYLLRGGFLDGMAGLIVAVLATHYVFLKDAKLWDLQLGGGREGRR